MENNEGFTRNQIDIDNNMENILKRKSEKLQSICRICLSENIARSKCLYDIHETVSFAEMVMLCSRVELKNNDALPDIICCQCLEDLQIANNFRIKCETSDHFLKKFYSDNFTVKDTLIDESKENLNSVIKKEIVKSESEDDDFYYIDNCISSPSVVNKHKTRMKIGYNLSKNKTNVVRVQDKSGKVICGDCGKPLSNKYALVKHLEAMHGEDRKKRVGTVTGYGATKRYHCPECNYSTPRRHNLVSHRTIHSGEKPFVCSICGASYTQRGSLISHTRTIHSDKTYFTCPECGKQFKVRARYERHKLVHTKTKKYPCTRCDKKFKTLYSLEQHTNRHLNIRNYNCDVCGCMFISRPELTNHFKLHNPVRNMECNICPFRTATKSTLKVHLKRHTGDREFKCDLCDFTAYYRGGITRHMRTHTKEKKYECPVCEAKFGQSSCVNSHMLRLHGINYKVKDHMDRRFIK